MLLYLNHGEYTRSAATQAVEDSAFLRDGCDMDLFDIRLHYPTNPGTECLVPSSCHAHVKPCGFCQAVGCRECHVGAEIGRHIQSVKLLVCLNGR